MLIPGNLFRLIINTQVLEGVITPITLVFVLVLANRRSLLGAAANGRLARSVGLVTVLAVGGLRLVPGGRHRRSAGSGCPCDRRGWHGLPVRRAPVSGTWGQFAPKYLAGRVFVFYVPARPGCPCLASG